MTASKCSMGRPMWWCYRYVARLLAASLLCTFALDFLSSCLFSAGCGRFYQSLVPEIRFRFVPRFMLNISIRPISLSFSLLFLYCSVSFTPFFGFRFHPPNLFVLIWFAGKIVLWLFFYLVASSIAYHVQFILDRWFFRFCSLSLSLCFGLITQFVLFSFL